MVNKQMRVVANSKQESIATKRRWGIVVYMPTAYRHEDFGVYHDMSSYETSTDVEDMNVRNDDLAEGAVEGRRGRGWRNAALSCARSHFDAIRWATSNARSTSALEGDVCGVCARRSKKRRRMD